MYGEAMTKQFKTKKFTEYKDKNLQEFSYLLGLFYGKVGTFCEVITKGAKNLAFSEPFYLDDEKLLAPYVEKTTKEYGVKYFFEDSLMLTRLFASVDMDGKGVYILFKEDKYFERYMALKSQEKKLLEENLYSEKEQINLGRELGRLMSYSENVINELLNI